MKDGKSIGKSRNARMNQAGKYAALLLAALETAKGTPHNIAVTDADLWEECRSLVGLISQCVHEANAYNNVMVGPGESFDVEVFSVVKTPATETV